MIETKASDHEMIIMPKGENVSVSLEKSPVGADDWPFFGSWQKGVGGESSSEACGARGKGSKRDSGPKGSWEVRGQALTNGAGIGKKQWNTWWYRGV